MQEQILISEFKWYLFFKVSATVYFGTEKERVLHTERRTGACACYSLKYDTLNVKC